MAKIISDRQRLEAFALYTMAIHHYAKCREFEAAVSDILGTTDGAEPYNDHVSDGIYGYRQPLAFDKVLEAAGVTIKTPKPKRKARSA